MEIPGVEIASLPLERQAVLRDYLLAYQSRRVSLTGRREVMSGKAKFGIFGDGKEVAQVALARVLRPGDFRSGYYRDQTLMFALGISTVADFFSQLYANTDPQFEPNSAGGQMNAHYASRSLNDDGSWKDLTAQFNSSADMSPTAGQMPRLVGLAYASKLYRQLPGLYDKIKFSERGNEIAFGTIGNASCAEGHFWEAINAAAVLQVPMVVSIWDDGYGISVPNRYQVARSDVSAALSGFQRNTLQEKGIDIYRVPGWDYVALLEAYQQAAEKGRREHVPAVVHVQEMTQPLGHSSSGSHERYKSEDRLNWEREHDCLPRMRKWVEQRGFASSDELDELERDVQSEVEAIRRSAWQQFVTPIRNQVQQFADVLDDLPLKAEPRAKVDEIRDRLLSRPNPLRHEISVATQNVLNPLREESVNARQILIDWHRDFYERIREGYAQHHVNERSVAPTAAEYSDESSLWPGYQIIQAGFGMMLERDPRVIAFGEDVGQLGDVNQGMAGLQAQFGELRVTDTGIRETTIVGQAIGMALRGLRPIAEIQYLDYLLFGLQTLSDDLASTRWRSAGGQKAPVIIRTRGHRLEGIWHSGSPLGMAINALRGMVVAVPRNMVQAMGIYNALLLGDDPGLVIEVLNGYRLKERVPDNLGEYTVLPGTIDVIREGRDITLVTYGANCKLALQAADQLAEVEIEIEVIDVQTLLPFDIEHRIEASLQKTNRVLFLDEDVPGGASAYMMQKVLEGQNGFQWLDSPPRTIAAREHRPAYGSDGNYWSKPNIETIYNPDSTSPNQGRKDGN